MKINCIHGFFIFEEQRAGEVSDFVSLFGLELVRKENVFIFADLEDAPDYSIEGGEYLDAAATETFAGEPWEVMRENELVYNFDKGVVEPLSAITQLCTLEVAGNVFVSPGLILPGSLTDGGKRVTDYAAWFSTDTMRFRYSEVSFAD